MDDMWHDFFVNSFAEMQAGRPLELFTHDLYSGRKIRWGVRVRVKGDDGRYKGLEERMARLILAATLYLDGYSPRGTTIVIEHGTATIPAAMRTALYELSGGLISFSLSGMQGAAAHGGQYPGVSRGNPRHKASLESSNNLTHNVFACLPAQTGKDVASRPEGLSAMLKENDLLLRAYATLPPAQAARLQFALVELNDFHSFAHQFYGQIENDPDHNLTDWAQCGHLVQQAWVDGGWRDIPPMDSLTGQARENLLAGLEDGTLKTRLRHMTRREVWDQGAGELIKLPGHGVWDILQGDLGSERRVTGNELAFYDQEVAPGKLRFCTRGVGASDQLVELSDGKEYRVVVNPFAPDTAFVGDLTGRYLGEFRTVLRPTRANEDDPAMQAAFGAAAKTRCGIARTIARPPRRRGEGQGRPPAPQCRRHRREPEGDQGRASGRGTRADLGRDHQGQILSQDQTHGGGRGASADGFRTGGRPGKRASRGRNPRPALVRDHRSPRNPNTSP